VKKSLAIAAGAFYLGSLGLPKQFMRAYGRSGMKSTAGKIASAATSTSLLPVTLPIAFVVVAVDKNNVVYDGITNLIKKMENN
jgi:hypothetical protein